jgi:hypothetical protein
MNLKHLTMDSCPDCSSPARREEFGYTHVNGGREEYKDFECGKRLHFIPNSLPKEWIEEVHPCSHTKEQIMIEMKRDKARLLIQAFVEKLDVDEKWKKELLGWRLGMWK